MLAAVAINKAIEGHAVLKSVSVAMNTGELTVVIGPNGAGKSTLLRCLSLIDPPDSGNITIGDQSHAFPLASNTKLNPPWPKLTMVSQGLHLWPHLTLRENMLLPARKRGMSSTSELFKSLVTEFDLAAVL